ncbi:L,D-transpeptidase family protein [Catenuloplanes indicus]|uniref:L,D-TPase catalytic domain-containing protein n=1 Tax=Catenuloplanes indicus TaxID=137267 RepID=A0AAE3VV72_9ACTN|nr:L,D-transpeptidase family protein [Catenuloplanes indicus]MDQ0363914.1 hypothetical protein [Catenuloplanes indicus]
MTYLLSAAAVLGLVATAAAGDVLDLMHPATAPAQVAPAPAAPAAGTAVVTVLRQDPASTRATAADAPAPRPPASAPAPGPATAAAGADTAVVACAGGRWQRDIEEHLAGLGGYGPVSVDGRSSPADCAAIRAFQQRFGIEPAAGQADPATADVARRIAASTDPKRERQCRAGAGVTACVDLTLQTVWVMRAGAVVFGPTVVRTGFRGHATPAGVYRINKRAVREWSDPYEVWLPYWQRFIGGIGFHETTTYLHDAARGSHGCVNLLHRDAVAMWKQLQTGARVHTFGRRPGT